jgi:hypothetical protein
MAIDTSWSTWMREAGIKTYVRTGLFRRKRTKTYDRFSSKAERRQYDAWKAAKLKAEDDRITNLFQPSEVALEAVNIIQNTSPSQRELDNIALLESIQRIEAVDLSLERSNYAIDNSIEKKYPGLVDSIFSNVQSYGNEFRDEEEYAQVVVTNTINNKSEILSHINWMVTPPTSTTDVDIRDANSLGSWVLQTTEDVGMGIGSDESDGNLGVKDTEKPKSPKRKGILRPIGAPTSEIKRDGNNIAKNIKLPFDTKKYNEWRNRGNTPNAFDRMMDTIEENGSPFGRKE